MSMSDDTGASTEPKVLMHLSIPQRDYEQLKQAGERSFRSPNREALWRLRQSLTEPATA
jgi:hypothetical protein